MFIYIHKIRNCLRLYRNNLIKTVCSGKGIGKVVLAGYTYLFNKEAGNLLKYLIRRSAYSVLIILGVMIVTFVLFRVAAGDPAAAILGKNPSPEEVEQLREELGSNRPLFWGWWRSTECFSGADFSTGQAPPRTKISNGKIKDGILLLDNGSIEFKRNFAVPGSRTKAIVRYRGQLKISGKEFNSPEWQSADFIISRKTVNLVIGTPGSAEIRYLRFERSQSSPLNSQLAASFGELVSFSPDFPYISFLNFGRSLTTREPVRQVLWRGIWPSLCLMLPIFFGELIIGIVLAMLSATCRDSWIDRAIVIASVAGMSISYLVFIIFGQWYLGYYYNLFPVWGWGDVRHLLLPVMIGIISGLGGGIRFYRTVFINELNREYLRTARAKGCNKASVYFKHLLRNAAIPIIARSTTVLPFLFTGSLLLETFFGIPGLGYAGINALHNADLQLLKALVILGALMFVVINLLADFSYAWADPRIRLNR